MASLHAPSPSPRTLRIEVMPLDCGGAAVVVELDVAPERAWLKAFKRALSDAEGLELATAKFDGRFVYILGVEAGKGGTAHRVGHVLAAAGQRGRPAPSAMPVPVPVAADAAMAIGA
ncbi:MAG: hypothetical protein GAK31_00994 [Stenotrophomonas maltophilia]|uniref:Uncharacterized protein n=1 Tax=Stenotrophomonas maltophilia TaxID=40324 RepID=A0A7V8JM02_STEMA|nr:MAG: hypothetical protein GAK31_00994 [Stenotrophomonas maltophilia]